MEYCIDCGVEIKNYKAKQGISFIMSIIVKGMTTGLMITKGYGLHQAIRTIYSIIMKSRAYLKTTIQNKER